MPYPLRSMLYALCPLPLLFLLTRVDDPINHLFAELVSEFLIDWSGSLLERFLVGYGHL